MGCGEWLECPADFDTVGQHGCVGGTDAGITDGVEGAGNHQGDVEARKGREDKAVLAYKLESINQRKGEVLLMVSVPLGEDVPPLVAGVDVVGTPLVHVGQSQFEIAARLHQTAASHHRHIVVVEGEIKLIA